MNIMTKRGGLDNIATFEHVCDRKADLDNIPKNQITLGSLAIILKGENDGLEVYMANSKKEWILLMGSSGSGGGGGIDLSQDTVDVLHLVEGYTAHDSTGAPIVGQVPIRTIDDLIQSGDIITMPGGYYASSIQINTKKDYDNLTFIDYDGTIVESYNTKKALQLNTLPENPQHENLVSQGWNWTLEEIQAYLNKYPYGEVIVGQQYTTFSGALELYIQILANSKRLIEMQCFSNVSQLYVHWGDGREEIVNGFENGFGDDIYSFQLSHTYSGTQIHTTILIQIDIPENLRNESTFFGTFVLPRDNIFKMRTGERQKITADAYAGLPSDPPNFQEIIFSKGTTLFYDREFNDAGSSPYLDNLSVQTIILPRSLQQIDPFYNMHDLKIISLPGNFKNILTLQFKDCTALEHITLPLSLETFHSSSSTGQGSFYNCHSLKQIIIPDTTNVSALTDAFCNCSNLTQVVFPKQCVEGCSYQYTFSGCKKLHRIPLMEGATGIGGYYPQNLAKQEEVIYPESLESLTQLGNFNTEKIYIKNNTKVIPLSVRASTFSGSIFVPKNLLNEYRQATNWSTAKDHIYGYEEQRISINDSSYKTMPYMTWLEWINSDYNTINMKIDGNGRVILNQYGYYIYPVNNDQPIYMNDHVIAFSQYWD